MSEAEHTPGPWEYVPSTEHHGPYVTTASDGTYGDIADCYAMSNPNALSVRNGGDSRPIHHQPDHADANARLIAAAPELLQACKDLSNIVQAFSYHTQLGKTQKARFEAAKAAIAKATGSAS